METPLVSICSITYNHAPFIRQCLDSFLMQRTSFPSEIIINDDCSTDGTTEIIREYARAYPDKIFPVFHEENLYSKGVRSMFARFTYTKAQGKYIAICEGDDFWIDPLKLQKQADFLESHPEYSMVCCGADILTKNGIAHWCEYPDNQDIPLKDIITKGGGGIHTPSIMFRAELVKDVPKEYLECHVSDLPLAIHLGLKGKVFYLKENMVGYRYMVSDTSWSSQVRINEAYFANILSEINMLRAYNEFSHHQYDALFKKRMGKTAIFYLRRVPHMKEKMLEALPDFPKWLSLSDKLKWWRIRLGIMKRKT